jgi:hypothetical protein
MSYTFWCSWIIVVQLCEESTLLGPVQIRTTVGIEVTDEADEIRRHILCSVDVGDVGTVCLDPHDGNSGSVLAGEVMNGLTAPR